MPRDVERIADEMRWENCSSYKATAWKTREGGISPVQGIICEKARFVYEYLKRKSKKAPYRKADEENKAAEDGGSHQFWERTGIHITLCWRGGKLWQRGCRALPVLYMSRDYIRTTWRLEKRRRDVANSARQGMTAEMTNNFLFDMHVTIWGSRTEIRLH